MSRLNGRITRLEEQTGADEKTPVIVAGELVYDVLKGEPYTGDPDRAVIVANVDADLWALL
jgi:hypothetical protein